MKKSYKVLGMMSGSSLDGLDLAFCQFEVDDQQEPIQWKLLAAETRPFTEMWISRLQHLPQQSALTFAQTNTYFGHYMAELVQEFLVKHSVRPDFIASHGHTIFHFPEKRISVQIGDGAALAAKTGITVINDFRTQDVALDGEGTPLAPLADKHLFKGYDFYLNLGGIANITAATGNKHIAFDIGPGNQVLNLLAQQLGQEYDPNGAFARSGQVDETLLNTVNKKAYFHQPYPKSLDNNWIRENIFPDYLQATCSIPDKLRSACEQLAQQLGIAIEQIIKKETFVKEQYRLLVSGGGAFNTFLIERMQAVLNPLAVEIVIPEDDIIQFKEAILMALLGVLRMEKRVNCLRSVTGAKKDSISGAIHYIKANTK